jgi:hypothetical protein
MPTGSPSSNSVTGSRRPISPTPPSNPQQQQQVGTGGGLDGPRLSKTNLYIRGLSPDTTDKDLVNLCQQYGKIISTKAIIDQVTSKCKGYGFVDYDSVQSAEAAIKALQAAGIQAQMAKQQEQDPTNLYISNLPPYVTETDLEAMFSPYGKVISTRILRDPHGLSRGVGFARMDNKETCDAIINAFSGKSLHGQSELLMVKFADSGSKKKLQQRQWLDAAPLTFSLSPYDPVAFSQNGIVSPTLVPSSSLVPLPRYSVPSVSGYQLPTAGWLHYPGQYIVLQGGGPSAEGSVVSQLSMQMNQMQLSPPPFLSSPPPPTACVPVAYPPMQIHAVPVEDCSAVSRSGLMNTQYYLPYTSSAVQK